jgi:hypothetical protein
MCVNSLRESNGKKTGRRQHQERQQVPCLGVYRSGQLRYSLLPGGAAFL